MRLLAVGAAVVAFLTASAVVARVIAAGSAARAEATDAIKRKAGSGNVEILRVDGIAGFALGARTETARIAWKAGDRLPVVQCVRVRRTGDPVAGYETAVVGMSAPIGREEECPGR